MKKIVIMFVIGLLTRQIIKAQGVITYLSNLSEPSIGNVSSVGYSFLTGNNTGGYLLNSIQLAMTSASGNPNNFIITLYLITNPSGGPLDNLGTLTGSSDPATSGVYTYTAPSNLVLSPDSTYIFSGTWSGSGTYEWSVTSTISSEAYDGWSGPGFDNYALGTEFGQYSINATPIPEPSILGLLSLSSLFFIRRCRVFES